MRLHRHILLGRNVHSTGYAHLVFHRFALLFVDDIANTAFISQYPKLRSAIYAFAAQPRFAYFSEGFIRLSDLVFFASAIIVLLIWTYISIEKRRWNRG